MNKRPWTTGPWTAADFMSLFMQAGNIKLACKSPEMAELLILLISKFDTSIHYGMTTAESIALSAKQLLKEVGYNANED